MSNRFKYIQDILEEVAEEVGVPLTEVEIAWDYTERRLGEYLREPMAPKVSMNGMYRFVPDRDKILREIFKNLHKSRNSKRYDNKHRIGLEIVRLLRIHSRVRIEAESYMDRLQYLNKGRNEGSKQS